jgi:hypothetical protein
MGEGGNFNASALAGCQSRGFPGNLSSIGSAKVRFWFCGWFTALVTLRVYSRANGALLAKQAFDFNELPVQCIIAVSISAWLTLQGSIVK